MERLLLSLAACCLAIFTLILSLPVMASENLKKPDAHFTVDEPARLEGRAAEAVYRDILPKLRSGLKMSDYPPARDYLEWKRFNSAPYLSATHGNRFVNNYGNDKAESYQDWKTGSVMQEGAILIKDSFTAMRDGRTFPGAFFAMEKLKAGSSPKTADWRYVMVLPDGSVFGDSAIPTGSDMGFCHTCHAGVADTDYLFHFPAEHQRKPE